MTTTMARGEAMAAHGVVVHASLVHLGAVVQAGVAAQVGDRGQTPDLTSHLAGAVAQLMDHHQGVQCLPTCRLQQ